MTEQLNHNPKDLNKMTKTEITIHTDGSCKGNPGPGGYGAVIRRYEGGNEIKKRPMSGSSASTTNNRMELKAALHGLREIKRDEKAPITVYSDSQYLIFGMTGRVTKWKADGWLTAARKPVKNKEIWEELIAVSIGLNIHWEWVRGHDGDPRNEEADALARAAAERAV